MGANSILEGMDCKISIMRGKNPDWDKWNGLHKLERETKPEPPRTIIDVVDGTFLEFSTDYEELGDGVGQFPVAICITEDGQLHVAGVRDVQIIFGQTSMVVEVREERIVEMQELCVVCNHPLDNNRRCNNCGCYIGED